MLSRFLLAFALSLSATLLPASAQSSAPLEGTTVTRGWPDPLPQGRDVRRYAALPFLDTLALGYRIADAGDAPALEVAFRWTPGREGVFEGRRVPYRRLPSGLRLVAFVVTADVVQGDRRVGGFTLDVDSTRLGAGETLRLSPAVAWSHLFDGLSATEAATLVRAGDVRLANVRLVRAAFATVSTRRTARRDRRRDRVSHPTVVVLDSGADLAWDIAWLTGPGRGDASLASDLWDLVDEAEGDDDTELLVPALAGLAAVGVAAWQAGSVGVFASDAAPLGLAGGYTGRRFGLYAQVGVSASVLGLADRPETLQARLVGFGRRARWRAAPFVGAGVEARERIVCGIERCGAVDGVDLRPALSLGLAVPTRRVVYLVGADARTGRLQAGVIGRFGRSRGAQR